MAKCAESSKDKEKMPMKPAVSKGKKTSTSKGKKANPFAKKGGKFPVKKKK
jgi:hypothetical protein